MVNTSSCDKSDAVSAAMYMYLILERINYYYYYKYLPARENDQNSPKSAKWLKITFRGSKMVPKVSKWGF